MPQSLPDTIFFLSLSSLKWLAASKLVFSSFKIGLFLQFVFCSNFRYAMFNRVTVFEKFSIPASRGMGTKPICSPYGCPTIWLAKGSSGTEES